MMTSTEYHTEFGLWRNQPRRSALPGSQAEANIQSNLQQQAANQQLELMKQQVEAHLGAGLLSRPALEKLIKAEPTPREETAKAQVAAAGHVAPKDRFFPRLLKRLFGPQGRDTSQCRDTS
jgi:hypothetical protein